MPGVRISHGILGRPVADVRLSVEEAATLRIRTPREQKRVRLVDAQRRCLRHATGALLLATPVERTPDDKTGVVVGSICSGDVHVVLDADVGDDHVAQHWIGIGRTIKDQAIASIVRKINRRRA